uniref:cyclic nucleotide-binding domain-containing protein n=1 Tax=uncultured Erythrobacter sp. TaxID=263913 RepID=UPI00260CB969|nr:cyclic nucleotide-binding domain-containing protein [uncultured Erythrobacter sp.]
MPFDPSWLIHIGAALLLLAYAIRDELKLRLLIIVSTFIYIAYYYLAADPPLWDAIITSALMIVINIIVLGQIVLERTTFRLDPDEKALFDAFETLTPGQFRRIAKIATWRTSDDADGVILTREQEPSDSLFYLFEGTISVEKGDRRFRLPEGNFVGEVAFVLKRKTTATTIAPKGVRFVEWDSTVLRKLSDKYPALGNALNALLTRDLARKIGASFRPDDAMPADDQSDTLLQNAQAAR